MPEVNVADIHEKLGRLEAMSQERKDQTAELFRLVRGLNDKVATKDDVDAIQTRLRDHVEAEDAERSKLVREQRALQLRVVSLETDRKVVRTAVAVAIGAPPFIAALIEIIKWIVGKGHGA